MNFEGLERKCFFFRMLGIWCWSLNINYCLKLTCVFNPFFSKLLLQGMSFSLVLYSINVYVSESFGEDLGVTDTDMSDALSNDDDYEDSFIDDTEPQVFSPYSSTSDEGMHNFGLLGCFAILISSLSTYSYVL